MHTQHTDADILYHQTIKFQIIKILAPKIRLKSGLKLLDIIQLKWKYCIDLLLKLIIKLFS